MIRKLATALFGGRKSSNLAGFPQKLPGKKNLSPRKNRRRSRRSPNLLERNTPNPRPPAPNNPQLSRVSRSLPPSTRRSRRLRSVRKTGQDPAAIAKSSPNSSGQIADLNRLRQLKSQSEGNRERRRPNTRLSFNGDRSAGRLSRRRSRRLRTRTERESEKAIAQQPERNSLPESKLSSLPQPLLYSIRLLILGIGFGAISGTLLSALNATSNPLSAGVSSEKKAVSREPSGQQSDRTSPQSSALPLKQESGDLKTKIQTLAQEYPQFQTGTFFVDLDTGVYANQQGSATFAAASTIKIPVLVAFFQDVDRGKISLEEMLTMREDLIASEAGTMKNKQPGTKFSAIETATKMMTISDNTATNMLIERLGGMDALNVRFRRWGLKSTALRNLLPDIEGTNTTSPLDLANLIARVNQGELVSLRSRDLLFKIMRDVETNSLLPPGLGEGATIAHKTGSIGSLLADAGLINTPTGKRYIAVVMVKRPRNDVRATELIRALSRTVYQHFNEPIAAPKTTNTPADATGSVAAET